MQRNQTQWMQRRVRLATMLIFSLLLAACGGAVTAPPQAPAASTAPVDGAPTEGAALRAVALAPGEKLRVVATTNIVADVVRQVGGDRIELTALLPPGTDPHSYQATPDDLRQLSNAHAIFVNGLHLEETMAPVLENLDAPTPVISVNEGVTLRVLGAAHADEHAGEHAGVDPHTWMNPANVIVWSEYVARALSAMDPGNAEHYAATAAAYADELRALDAELRTAFAAIPGDQRKLVTDHDNLGYLADAYGFTILGAVVPSLSTLAAPSAQEMAALQDQMRAASVRVIVVGNTVNPATAQQLAQDTGAQVVAIYTDSLSDAAGPAPTYAAMTRYNAAAIVAAFGE
jgi:ABC-type Zn uptake system ZnuABC Zn-binding protein ZnuA